MKAVCKIIVRTYECDGYGHVNNANYLNYFEYARYEYLKTIGFDYESMVKAGYGIYIARVEIEYKKPAFTEDELTLESWAIKKGAVSGVIAQQITRGKDLIAEAKVTWAFVNKQGTPVRLPAQWDMPGLRPAE